MAWAYASSSLKFGDSLPSVSGGTITYPSSSYTDPEGNVQLVTAELLDMDQLLSSESTIITSDWVDHVLDGLLNP